MMKNETIEALGGGHPIQASLHQAHMVNLGSTLFSAFNTV